MQAKCKSAVIAGGGIVGLTCALRLLRQGIATTIVSPDEATPPASWGNAGHIAVEQVEPLASRKAMKEALRVLVAGGGAISAPLGDIRTWAPFFLRLARASGGARFRAGTAALGACMQRAMPAWRALLADLGQPELLIEDGHFVVWESARTARQGQRSWRDATLGPASFRTATRDEFERLAGLIGKQPAGAIRFEGSGQVADPGLLLDSLLRAITAAGGERVKSRARTITIGRDGQAAVDTGDGKSLSADAIIVTAGVESGPLLSPTGSVVPIIAERGYHIQAPTNAWPATMPPVVFEDRAMIVTRFLTALRASSFVEFARFERPPTQAKWARLQRHVTELGLPIRPPVSLWMGARPTLPDYLPAIGQSRRAANLFYAFGHQHLGLTLAAITAEVVADLVCRRTPFVDPKPFDIERFAS
ncbi:MAG: NAD(P)/FAD-dependent oxidoreductase [Woeseiaceae bacterium]